MESTALYDFSPENDSQLAFKKDETVLIVTPDRQDGWLLCEIRGRQGLAPKNYLSVLPNTWYKGKVPLAKIHSHLLSQPNDGAFIIHDSESTPGDFEISVKKNQNEVVSHKILRDGSWRFFLWVVKFNTINKLVDYHRAATIDRDGELYLKDCVETHVKAEWDFTSDKEGELSFKKGDPIEVLGSNESEGWWFGRLKWSQNGLFPSNYTVPWN
ncbi:growth factor receptor-bound protein 2-like [Convolutriloba macropyga]|uniref:growth factor receptor-bound protein 2-like n=1 Tax=Convolutriloba macropyga TaxID=536237 RepID=UPI003F527397